MYNVLLVDDEAIIREGIKKIIPWGEIGVSEVFLANSGVKALEVMEQKDIHVVLTDICMANMDGLNLIDEIKKKYSGVRIVVLTGYNNFEYAQKCCNMQVHNFLLKPVDEDELTNVLREQINVLEESNNQRKKDKVLSRAIGLTEQSRIEAAMKKLLKGIYEEQIMDSLYETYQWDKMQPMQVIVILPAISETKEWKDHDALLYMSVKNICLSLFDAKNQGITFEDDLGRIVVSIFIDTKLDEVQERVIALKSVLNDEFDMSLNILMGSRVNGFKELEISYNDAMSLFGTAIEKKNEVIIPMQAKMRLDMFEDTVKELVKIMEENTGDLDVLLKAYDTYIKCTNSYNVSDTTMKKTTFHLITGLYYIYVTELGDSPDSRLNSFLSMSISSNREEIGNQAREFIIQLFASEKKNPHELVRKAVTIIQERLAEDLSVTSLSEQLFVTTNYFSRLFKKEIGMGCNEYIVRKRIEKAKHLLETTSMKSGRIALAVGYKDINYFSLAFKKNVGVSPTEYREIIRN